jgi:putative SOS response-associated peptidase YedK
MPVILDGDEQQRWLDNEHRIDSADPLFAPILKTTLRLAPLDRSVGNASNKNPDAMALQGDWIDLDAGS